MIFPRSGFTSDEPKRHAESDYDFLCRSSLPYAYLIRKRIEKWLARVPTQHKRELAAKLGSNLDELFLPAYFELFMFALLKSIHIRTVYQPKVIGVASRPDFIFGTGESRVIIDATNVSGVSKKRQKHEMQRRRILDLIDQFYCPELTFHVEFSGYTSSTISLKDVAVFLDRNCKRADIKTIQTPHGTVRNRPSWVFKADEFQMIIHPYRRDRRFVGPEHGSLMSSGAEGFYGNSGGPISEAIQDKGKQHKNHKLPLIVAVNCLGMFVDKSDVEQALYGSVVQGVRLNKDFEGTPFAYRKRKSAWIAGNVTKYNRICAVLYVRRSIPGNYENCETCLYVNPYSDYNYIGDLCRLNTCKIEDGYCVYTPGSSAFNIIECGYLGA